LKELIDYQFSINPLRVIILSAIFIRLLAAFFSEGYAFHDDHFDVTRVAQHWAEGYPHWLESESPPKHSMLYAGINAVFIWVMGQLSIEDPVVKTTILRIIHAFYSLLVITLSYKITERLSDRRNANLVGWMLAFLWFMPYLSVKFLVELVCVPPVLGAIYLILKKNNKVRNYTLQQYFLSGALLGLAFTIRMHTILFAGALGLVMLFDKKWKESVIFTFGYLLVVTLLIGISDAILFDYPFHYVVNYFQHNSENAHNYISGSPFKFLLTTLGFLVPPISLFLIWGYLKKGFRISPQIFLAVAAFFIFHSAFPNQQERFILPMYPLLIIIGVIGWNEIKDKSAFWRRNIKLYRGIWIFFWAVNIIVAFALALTFSKRDRIEPLHYIFKKNDATSVLIEGQSVKQIPAYYMGSNAFDYREFQLDLMGLKAVKEEKRYLDPHFKFIFTLDRNTTIAQLKNQMDEVQKLPNYVILKGSGEIEQREEKVKDILATDKLTLEKIIYPSNYDRLLHFLNPKVHKNAVSYIYKAGD
jgi:hypothetical protein